MHTARTMTIVGWLGLLLLAACGPASNGPVLLSEQTYIPTVAVLPSITPSFTPSPTEPPTLAPFTPAVAITLVTPTLPPSRTPTLTFTPSNTPLPSATPSNTLPPTLPPPPTLTPPSAFVVPTITPFGQPAPSVPGVSGGATGGVAPAGINPVTAPRNPDGACAYAWFTNGPAGCPTSGPQTSAAASLAFEHGMLYWSGADGMITVTYADGQQPAWQRFPDTWREGMPERDMTIIGPQGLWQQPRRGFGQLWRTTPTVRARLGWALHEWEDSYTATQQQSGADSGSALYLTGQDGRVVALLDGGASWQILP